MNKIFALIASVFLLSSCASGPSQYWLDMQQYQGASEAQLIDALGPPDNQYTVDNMKYLTYSKISQQSYPTGGGGSGISFGVGSGGYHRNTGTWVGQEFGDRTTSVQTFRCDVFFAIRAKHVVKIGKRGNSC